jgi:hypothetical protein
MKNKKAPFSGAFFIDAGEKSQKFGFFRTRTEELASEAAGFVPESGLEVKRAAGA